MTGPDPLDLLPNLLMPGAAKSGTSSLAWYLGQHPEICLGDRKEPNYFLPLRYEPTPRQTLEEYGRHYAAWKGETYRLDASAGYLHSGDRVLEAVRETLGAPHTVIILRNPVDRFWSSYRAKRDRGVVDRATVFREFFEQACAVYASGEDRLRVNHHHRALGFGRYAEVLGPWLDALGDKVTIAFFEHLVAEPQRTVEELCIALGLDPAPAATFDYAVRNVTVTPRSVRVSALVRRVNLRVDRHFRAYPGAKQALRVAYKTVNGSSHREVLAPEDRAAVEEFYAPANKELFDLLTSHGVTRFPSWLAEAAQG